MDNINSFIREIAKDLDLNIVEVEDVIDSMFRSIKNNIESNKFNTLNIMYLGKFKPNKRGDKLKGKVNEEILKES